MKNYKVKVLFNFNDMEEKTKEGLDTPRKAGDIFNCTKERFIYLQEKGAVELIEIEETKSSTKSKEEKKVSTKSKQSKKKEIKED